MASFQTHITFGVSLGVVSAISLIRFAFVPFEWEIPIMVSVSAIIGAILPDMDSDTSLPFHITFGSLALIGSGFGFVMALRVFPGEYAWIVGLPLGIFFVIWVIIGSLFKRFTVHRGMAHSVPAAFLAGFVVYLCAIHFGFSLWNAFLIGIAMILGYVLHLVLDEVHAAINFHGTPFIPNKALGSALKFTSGSASVTTLVYVALILLFLINSTDLIFLVQKLVSDVITRIQ
ncbi:metal-dependent hydrolase [Candidatus Uhrbacteria bacterium]|nr:metal-dependent hydrolase [Candidatus Uhrbacteria bacterium]